MASQVVLPFDGDFNALRAKLAAWGFEVGERPNAPLFAKGHGVTIHGYRTGKLLLAGERAEEWATHLRAEVAPTAAPPEKYPMPEAATRGVRIGVDEAGKGDYFGPLVVAGVVVDEASAQRLRSMGVKDSKRLTDDAILRLAETVRANVLRPSQAEVITISPLRYNTLHQKLGSVNKILGWAHARAIESLLEANPTCATAVSDQFGDERYVRSALMERGRRIELVSIPKAEREISVAAASVLARAEFVLAMRLMSARYDVRFPLGATHVEDVARRFARERGAAELVNVAKVHFVTTTRVVEDLEPIKAALRARTQD